MAIPSMLFNQSAEWVQSTSSVFEESKTIKHSLTNVRVDISSKNVMFTSQGAQTSYSARLFYLAQTSRIDGDAGAPEFAVGDSIIFDSIEFRIVGSRRVCGANRLNHIEVELV